MKRLNTLAVLVAVSVLPGCKKKPAGEAKTASGSGSGSGSAAGSATAEAPKPPAGAGSPVEATLEGKPFKFAYAKIESAGGRDRVKLSTGPLKCGEDQADGDTVLNIDVEKGPGGMHYAPGPLTLDIEIYNSKQEFKIGNTLYAVLSFDNTEWKAGNKVKGTIKIDSATDDRSLKYTGQGSFEANVCDVSEDPESWQATPVEADKGPASGTISGKPFTVKSAIAEIHHNKARDVDEITTVKLFDAAVDCSNYKDFKGMSLGVGGSQGASGKDLFVGVHQPRQLWWMKDGTNFNMMGPVWIKFDSLELKPDTEFKGSVFGERNPAKAKANPQYGDAKLSGTISGKVCDNR